MTKKLFIGALVAITFAGSFAAVAAANNGGKGGGRGGPGPSAGETGGEYYSLLRPPLTHIPRKIPRQRQKLITDNCGCIVAVVQDIYGNVVKRGCNSKPHFNDQVLSFQCRANR